MSKNICTCETCSEYTVTDPLTGLSTQGQVVGRKEILAHRRFERIKKRLNDATVNDAPPPGSHSLTLSNPSDIQEELGPGPFQWLLSANLSLTMMLTALTACEAVHDTIRKIHAELSHRRTAYHTIPTKGLVFTTPSMLPGQASSGILALSSDAPINQALIEYEDWLTNTMSTLRGSLEERQQSHAETKLIEEITLATEEIHAAKHSEWSRQLTETQTSRPLPPSVADSQCTTVDGG